MFFQQTHTARNAVDEADERELEEYYLDPPPWFVAGNKRLSSVSALSSRSHRSGGDITPSPTPSLELTQLSQLPSVASCGGPGLYSRQTSAVQSRGSLPARGGFPTAKPGNPVWSRIKRILGSSFGLFILIQTYLCIGAFCFMWLEAAKETEQMQLMASQRLQTAERLVNCSGNVSCHEDILREWEQALVMFPQVYTEMDGIVWSWGSSYYCSFTIISTIGYGNVTPLSVFGRLFAVAYAVVGIPLMLLFITDTGNKFARWTKIAIIKFRQCNYKLGIYCQKRRRKGRVNSKTRGGEAEKEEAEADEGGGGEDDGGENDGHEVGRGATKRNEGRRGLSIPEVHINIAMSTLDEDCELETKDIEGAVGEEERYYGYGDAGLQACQDNSDYGGSSTGVEDCITNTNDRACEIVPSVTIEMPNSGESVTESVKDNLSVTESVKDNQEVELNSYLGSGDKLESSSIERTSHSSSSDASPDDVIVSMDTMKLRANTEGASFRERGDTTVDKQTDVQQTDVTTPRTNSPEPLEAQNKVCKYEPSDILHTSALHKKTAIGERTCDKCGQPMQNARKVKTDFNVEPECLQSAEEKEWGTKLALGRRGADTAKMFSVDSLSMDLEITPPLQKSLLSRREEEIPQFVATYFRHDSLMEDQPVKGLSKQESRSLDSINTFVEERTDTELPANHQPAMRTHRTSTPNVSFQTSTPKHNGHLPNRHFERCSSSGRYDDIRRAHKADNDTEGNFRDKPATDSGVASSTSNSTECSPKHLPIAKSSSDSSDNNDERLDDVISEDDVSDSEKKKDLEKLRPARLSTIGHRSMRISESDIVMLSIPIWLALLLLLMYLLLGAGCFAAMQGWSFLDGFYYCFISLSTIGFGDLVFLHQQLPAELIFSFLYSFLGLCFTSMCMSLSSMELTILSRKIASKFGVYRGRIRSLREKRWNSRRRHAIRAPLP